MKLRVESRDLMIFGIFCLFLLYFCAIIVLNVNELAVYGKFYGFLPFEAFTGDYIATTIMLFVFALLGIFSAVGSYIFDREKGFGFSLGKKDKGYSRWCKDSEMKKTLKEVDPAAYTADAAGLVVINNGKKMWVDNGEMHNVIVGATGSGKTQAVVFPLVQSLAKHEESMIITDPKGEIYQTTGEMLKERGYNVVILNFRDPQRGNAWNPMTLPYNLYKEGNMDKAIELLDDLALNILYEEKSGNSDPFWEKSGADYFSGLALGLFEDGTESQINLNSINLMATVGEERSGGPNSNYIKDYFNMKDPSKPAYINASGTVFTAEETKQGVLSTFKQKIKIFSNRENLSEMLSHSDFDMKDIGRKKTAVFLVIQDEKKTLHPLATIFIKQCYETLIDVAQESGGKLPYRTNFILDEFANMPPLKDVTTMVTAARSRLIRFNFIIQNYAQLTQVYGKENAETIKGNCNIMYLISNELSALEEISKMCGEVKSKEKDKTASTPLVTVSDLQRLSQFEMITLRLRMMPFKTKLTPDYKMNWGRKYPKADFPTRERVPLDLFDVREFVKEKKKEKMKSMFGNDDSGSLFGGPMPSNFGGNMGGAPFAFDNPFKPSASSSPTFNVEDLVKKIDEKIAELEKEESGASSSDSVNPILNNNMKEMPFLNNFSIPSSDKMEKNDNIDNVISNIEDDKNENNNYVNSSDDDDAFFDDFFSDN